MELALYDPVAGYYARAAQRSGRAGDFFTSVDVGPLFGELLATQVAEMARLLGPPAASRDVRFDLVEAGAGNGRLSADILRAIRRREPSLYSQLRLHLVETSAAARTAQRDVLDDMAETLASSSDVLPDSFEGVLLANELLDAMPVHQVVMRREGLREVYVEAERLDTGDRRLATTEGPLSTQELEEYLARLEVTLEPGWRVEVNLHAVDWIRTAARRLRRGFIIVIDYGHRAGELFSASHSAGTLTTFAAHNAEGSEGSPDTPAWLEGAGHRDITAHVDFTSIENAAHEEGLTTIGFLDQTYFLLGLAGAGGADGGISGVDASDMKTRLALKTLLMPGGLGSTHKVLILGKNVGSPMVLGCSYRRRVT